MGNGGLRGKVFFLVPSIILVLFFPIFGFATYKSYKKTKKFFSSKKKEIEDCLDIFKL